MVVNVHANHEGRKSLYVYMLSWIDQSFALQSMCICEVSLLSAPHVFGTLVIIVETVPIASLHCCYLRGCYAYMFS